MSTSSAQAVRELRSEIMREIAQNRREMAEQRQLMRDFNRMNVQMIARLELVEHFLENPTEQFQRRHQPQAHQFLSASSNELAQSERERENGRAVMASVENNNNPAPTVGHQENQENEVIILDPNPSTSSSTPSSSSSTGQNFVQSGIPGFAFHPKLDRRLNEATERMIRLEAEMRREELAQARVRRAEEEEQERNRRAEEEEARIRRGEMDRRERALRRAERQLLQQHAEETRLLERNQRVEAQLREIELFNSGGWPILPTTRLIHTDECAICMEASATMFGSCGHVCMCPQCALNSVLSGMVACPMCREPLETGTDGAVFHFWRPRGWWQQADH